MTETQDLEASRTQLDILLGVVLRLKGSDLHLKPGAPPSVRIGGQLKKLGASALDEETVRNIILSSMPDGVKQVYEKEGDADYAISSPHGRFRASAYTTRQMPAMVARMLSDKPQSLEELSVPVKVANLTTSLNGLILVTGATGSGKTTTLAAVIDSINQQREVKILTIEDPIEILHTDKKATVDQRELFSDTPSFAKALRQGLRQDPDVILVGELRDYDTAKVAMHAAETGHLVLSTLHTNSAPDTINRLIKMFPAEEEAQIRLTLADVLRGVVCQRLVPRIGGGMVPVVEIMSGEGRIPKGIAEPDRYDLGEIIAQDRNHGMQTFEEHLIMLVEEGYITSDNAKKASLNPHDLEIKLRQLRNRNH